MKYLIYALEAITVIRCKKAEMSGNPDKTAKTQNIEIADKIITPQLPLHCIGNRVS